MPRQQNPFAHYGTGAGFSGPGYSYPGTGGSDIAGGISTLAKALFAAPGIRNKADVDQAHSDYYKALSAKNGIEIQNLNDANGARGSIADMYRQIPSLMAARNVQGPTPSGDTVDEVATQSLANMPSQIAAAATRLPANEQGHVGDLFLFQNANNPAASDESVARSFVGAGKTIGKEQAVSLPDRKAVAARDQADAMSLENVRSGDRRYATDQSTATRSEIADAVLQERIRNNDAVLAERARQTDVRSGDTQRGQDVRAGTSERGQDVRAGTAQRGQDIGSETARRGQDITSDDRQRGQDIGSADRQRGQDLRAGGAGGVKVAPQDYRRYAGILSDIGAKSDPGDTLYEPDAEAAIVGRAAEIYRDTKDAVGATRQALMEFGPQLERRDSSYNPMSKRRFGLKGAGTVSEAVTSPAGAPAAAPAEPTATAAPGSGGTAAGQHAPGSMVEYQGRKYTVGPDGNSLLPVQ